MVSVVIPYFNRSHSIKNCINSVLIQTYKDFELIIVDDGSSDWEIAQGIIDEFNETKIKIIHHSINKNGSAARNSGIKDAIGNYIALLDSDDEWMPDHLQNCINCAENLHINKFLIFSSIKINATNGEKQYSMVVPKINNFEVANVSEFIFCEGMPISCPTYFFTRDIINEFEFDETLPRFQDIAFVLELNKNEIPIIQSAHIGAIVNWQGDTFLDSIKKGVTTSYVEIFVKDYYYHFTDLARARFLIDNLLLMLFYNFEINKVVKAIRQYRLYRYINSKDLARLYSYMFFKRSKFIWKILRELKMFFFRT